MKKRDGKKNIYLLGGSSMFNDAGSEMIASILPFYITALGGGGVAIGALSGLREGLASIFKLLGGWYSDKLGKRMPFVFLGYLFSIISRFMLAIANSWQLIIGFVSLERLGKARDAPRDALIAKFTKKRGWGFGIHQMFDTAGGIIGSILVLFLLWRLNLELKTIILLAGMLSSLALIPLFFVKDVSSKPTKISLFKGINDLDKNLKYFIFVTAVFTLANFGLYMFLLLKAKEITGSIVTSIGLGVLFNVVWAFLSVTFGNLSDRLGRKTVIIMGYILFFAVSLGFVYANSLLALVILFISYGLVYAITNANQRAFVSDLSGKTKGTAQGFYQFVLGLASIMGGIIAGFFWSISPASMFIYLSAVSLISIILFLFVKDGNSDARTA